MWDEKKFFEDFVKESDEIKPDKVFVQRMKQLEKEECKKKNPVIRYAAVAAVFVCVISGAAVWKNAGKEAEIPLNRIDQNIEVQAGKNELSIQSGSIGKKPNESFSEMLLSIEKENTVIVDEEGNELSQREKSELLERLKKAKLIDEEIDEAYKYYFCQGEKNFELKVYEEQDGETKVFVDVEK